MKKAILDFVLSFNRMFYRKNTFGQPRITLQEPINMKLMRFLLLIIIIVFMVTSCNKNENKYLYVITKDGKYGFIDSTGKEIIKPKYIYAASFSEGLALVVNDTLILRDSIVKYDVDLNTIFSKSPKKSKYKAERIRKYYKYGYINISGDYVIKPTLLYESNPEDTEELQIISSVYSFSDGLAVFKDSAKKMDGYIAKDGRVVIKPKFEMANKFSEGLAPVSIFTDTLKLNSPETKMGYINKSGQFVIEPKYSVAYNFHDGLASVVYIYSDKTDDNISKMWHSESLIINNKGKTIGRPLSFIHIKPFNDGFAIIEREVFKQFKFIDKLQVEKTNWLDEVTRFGNGLAGVKINNKWGFINKKFVIFIKPKYDNARPFNDGLAAVKKDRYWGYIDTLGIEIIPFKYDSCTFFRHGLAEFFISENGLMINGYINKKNEVVWQQEKITSSNN